MQLTVSFNQVTYYDDGGGAEVTGLNRMMDGAFGHGLLQVESILHPQATVFSTLDRGAIKFQLQRPPQSSIPSDAC